MTTSLDPRIRRADLVSGGGLLSLIICFVVTSNALAQTGWPEHCSPGLRFDQLRWCEDTSTLQWIRNHHLKSFSCISYSFNYPHRIDSTGPWDMIPVFDSSKYSPVADTETWTFSYSGDTLIASNFNSELRSTTIIKFDNRNTEREYGNVQNDPRSSSIHLYDTVGRELSYMQWWVGSDSVVTVAQITDSTNCSIVDYEDTKTITYWGLSHRIDSEIDWHHETDAHVNDLNLWKRIRNYYDNRNQIIAAKTIVYDNNRENIVYSDTAIRDSKGIIVRKSEHIMYLPNASECLYYESLFDSHGNKTYELRRPEIGHFNISCAFLPRLDTIIIHYKYDKRGRPIEQIEEQSLCYPPSNDTTFSINTTFYKWRNDNLPLACNILRSNGTVFVTEKYLYEF